jgi:tetratricopeptide (TPR) repeat protein
MADEHGSSDRWHTIAELFAQAIALPPEQRAEFAVAACGQDEALRAELCSLLAASEDAEGWFGRLEREVAPPARASRLSPAPDPWPTESTRQATERSLRHYEALAPVGAGGMGEVYRARDVRLDRQVALKFVSRDRLGDSDAVRRLVREARSASALEHPAICTIYGIEDTSGGELCIVMAFCGGGTLKDRLAAGPLPVEEVLHIGRQLASGLAYAHASGFVHRDLKPANMGFSSDGSAKLLDFGLSIHGSSVSESDAGRIAGTLSYMAPEQIRGEPVDARADVWSLGVILYEMLCGHRPFAAADDPATMFAVLEREPRPIEELRADVPPRLAALVARMLRKAREERPGDGRAVHDELAALSPLVAAPVARLAATAAPGIAPRRRPARRMRAALLLPIAIALLAVLLTWRLWGDTAPPLPPGDAVAAAPDARMPVAVFPFAVHGNGELAYLRDGMVDLLAATLDGVGGLRGVDPNAVLGISANASDAMNPAQAREAAARLGVHRYVLGSVVQLGAGMQLTAVLYDAGGAERARARTIIESDSALMQGVDDLARQLVASEFTAPAENLAGLAAMTTHSLPALRAYLEGERLLRDARPEAAVVRFGEAVARDSMFALAWYRLARAAGWRQMDSLNLMATEAARRHADALPPRVRRIVEAYHHLRTGDPREAERRLRTIVEEQPDDAESWMLLGEALFHNNPTLGRSSGEARDALERAMRLDPQNREVTVHLMDLAARDQRLGTLDTLFRMYFSPRSEGEQPGVRHAYIALHKRLLGSDDGPTASVRTLENAGDEAVLVALVRVAPQLEDLEFARALASGLAMPGHSPESRSAGYLTLAMVDVAQGRWTHAEAAWREAAAHDSGAAALYRATAYAIPGAVVPRDSLLALRRALVAWNPDVAPLDAAVAAAEQEPVRLYLIGLLSLRLMDPTRTTEMRRRLLEHAADSSARRLRAALAASLLGHAALDRGRPEAALIALREATLHWPFARRAGSPILEQHLDRFARGNALLALGRPEEALAWYASLHEGYHLLGVPYLGASLVRRAEILERLGRSEEARGHYERALRLWRDADPSLQPMLDLVLRRLGARPAS